MTSKIDERIGGHYGWSGLMEAIEQEIRGKGIDPQQVTVADLAPVDNFHWHRLAGTLALARAAGIGAADRVLDVGGGIGGPARQLAHRFGCHVTVLDLTAEYCEVGARLTAWTGLADLVSFVNANALEMPFPDASFDVVWTQHASMNIPDKAGLYGEIARVVRQGGRFAFFDVLAGPNQPIHFPVPWASDPSFSFLLSPEETRALIAGAGFREISWMADEALEAELERPDPLADEVPARPGLNPGLLNGPDGPRMGANVARNSDEGRILPVLGVFERA
jgi:ubiquinone/menaquinone biosynthesis C-methylase UbiE